jgi:hypothetical protein
MRYGEELQIVLLDSNQRGEIATAGGPWAGVPWPDGMLVGPPAQLGDLICPIMNPHVQLEIKERFGNGSLIYRRARRIRWILHACVPLCHANVSLSNNEIDRNDVARLERRQRQIRGVE